MAYIPQGDDDNELSRSAHGVIGLPDVFFIRSKNDIFELAHFKKVQIKKNINGETILEFMKDAQNPQQRPKIIFDSAEGFQNLNLRLEAYECDIHIANNTFFENSTLNISSRHFSTGENVRLIETDFSLYNSYLGKTNIGDGFGFYSDKKDNNFFIVSSSITIGESFYARAGDFSIGSWGWESRSETAEIGRNSKLEVDFYKNLTTLYADESVSIEASQYFNSKERHFHQKPDNEVTQSTETKTVMQRIANFLGIK